MDKFFYKIKRLFCGLFITPFIRNKYKRKYVIGSMTRAFWRSVWMYFFYNPKNEPKAFKYDLAFTCIIKNEALNIKEWIDYHKLVGVKHFYVYDNGSTDNVLEVLKPYMDDGLVTYTPYPGQLMQHRAYNDAVRNYKNECKWMSFIDLDEFVVPKVNKTIPEFLEAYENYSQVLMFWMMYGSSNHKDRPQGLVIENYTCHAEKTDDHTKQIVNPRRVIYADVHYSFVVGEITDENFKKHYSNVHSLASSEKIQVNHYFIKSYEDFCNKYSKGRTDNRGFGDLDKCFQENDINDVCDDLMAEYVKELKRIDNVRNLNE